MLGIAPEGTINSLLGKRGGGGFSYDFSSSLPSAVTFSRASTATYFDAVGAMQLATSNTPRFDHDPVTLDTFGLQIEGPSTNLLLNSLLNGTNLSTQSITVTAQGYSLSFYGSGTITLSGTATGTLFGSSIANEKVSLVFTPTAGTLTLTVAGTVKWAQLETGIISSSFIPTTGSTASRAEDFVAFQGVALSLLQAAQGSVVVSLRKSTNYTNTAIIGPNNTLNTRFFSDYNGALNQAGVALYGQNNFCDSGLALSAGRPQRAGMTWNGLNFSVCVDGYTVANATAPSLPVAATNYYLGSASLGAFGGNLFGWVTGVTLYNIAIPNSSLQQATSLSAPAGIGNAVPQGAAALGYNTNVININPAVSDIAPTNNAAGYALADVLYYQVKPANPGAFSMTGGVLTMPFGNQVITQKQNSTASTLPYLAGVTGFYIEYDVALSDNDQQNWPAVWSLPWEHNLAQTDHYGGDPAGYERWMELDVDEGGFNKDTLSSVVDWQGTFDSGTGQVWRDYPTNTVPGNVITQLQALGYFDRTQKHTFGASYSPNEGATGVARFYLDNRLIFKAAAPIIARQQHFYMIAGAQSHGSHNYNMFLYRMRAYTP